MNKQDLVLYWQNFFSDLLVGTFRRVIFFSIQGITVGLLTAFIWKFFYGDSITKDSSSWFQGTIFLIVFIWYGLFGVVHGLFASLISTIHHKFSEAIGGLHDLFDFLSRSVLNTVPKLNQTISKKEMEQRFIDFGKSFLRNLRLRKGVISWFVVLGFSCILKVFKILFLNNVADELSRKPGKEITASDIESAVRRVGVEAILNPVTDYLLLMHAVNLTLMLISFGIPYLFYWFFF